MHGSHLIKAYSRTQSNIALSSGEAEFYALVSTASEALGVLAMSEDFGDKTEAYLYADASAAIGVANREGLGRIRHLDTQSLWLQQALRKRRLGLGKVLGTENPSNLMTCVFGRTTLRYVCGPVLHTVEQETVAIEKFFTKSHKVIVA